MSIGSLFFFIPSLAEILKSVHLATGVNLDDQELNEKASSIYNTFFCLGSIIGPPIGGALKDSIQYRQTNDVMAGIALIFTACYLVMNVLCIADSDAFTSKDTEY